MKPPKIRLMLALVFVTLAVVPQSFAGTAAFRWHGYATTDLSFSEFWSGNNTIMARFMPQYTLAYRGPILGARPVRCAFCSPGSSFSLAMGDATEGTAFGPTLALEIAGNLWIFAAPTMQPGRWQHVALTRGDVYGYSFFRLYLNGTQLCTTSGACNLVIPIPGAPSGSLMIGRTSNSANGPPDDLQQFYGFVDDVAVFKKQLTATEVATYAEKTHLLSGTENGLYAGWTFDLDPPPPLDRPVSFWSGAFTMPFAGGATLFNYGYDADKHDSGFLPVAQYAMPLPFASGQQWHVGQGNSSTGSHYGSSAFSLDMSRVDDDTIGSGVYNMLGGTIAFALDSWNDISTCGKLTGSTSNCNVLQIQVAPGYVLSYRHLQKGSIAAAFGGADPAVGTWVPAGKLVAKVGDHPNGAHLHFGVRTNPQTSSAAGVTFAVVYENYQVKNAYGTWDDVSFGVPKEDATIAIP